VSREAKLSIRAQIVVVAPPTGVVFALQRGRRELGAPATSSRQDLQFDFTLLAGRSADGSPRFSGEFVQGPAGGKFVYVNSGTLAGQADSCWTRRAKVHLKTLKWATVERAAAAGHLLRARIAGTARDGGPACASVPLLAGWIAVPADEPRGGRRRKASRK
jgi:hypothetical protein